jgi:hypothetical protein
MGIEILALEANQVKGRVAITACRRRHLAGRYVLRLRHDCQFTRRRPGACHH